MDTGSQPPPPRGGVAVLIGDAPDGPRGEPILAEVSRSHGERTWMLPDEASMRRSTHDRSRDDPGGTRRAQENWDNEGGPVRIDPPSS